jgi:hypothetical protein
MSSTSSGFALRVGCIAAVALGAGLAAPDALAHRHGHFIGETVVVAPPPAQVEVIGDPPHRGYVYEKGYWRWVDGRHVWVRGHWMAPRPGYYWEPHIWVHEGNGWRMREGYWARR